MIFLRLLAVTSESDDVDSHLSFCAFHFIHVNMCCVSSALSFPVALSLISFSFLLRSNRLYVRVISNFPPTSPGRTLCAGNHIIVIVIIDRSSGQHTYNGCQMESQLKSYMRRAFPTSRNNKQKSFVSQKSIFHNSFQSHPPIFTLFVFFARDSF